jgi:hypothetical protein
MRPVLLICVLFFSIQMPYAQKGIDGLIQAEKNFAAYSVAHSTKEAFLQFLDSAGIVFENGTAVSGIASWNKKEKRPGMLDWSPQHAEIAASNDFGYTTGPWTYRQSANDPVIASGQYVTVWHIDGKGEWKFLLDLGISNVPLHPGSEVRKINVDKLAGKTGSLQDASLAAAENEFIKIFSQNKQEAYRKYLSDQSILNRNGHLPAINKTEQSLVIDSTSSFLQFTPAGQVLAPSSDMGFVYGKTVLNGKTENYQRIWRREKGGWKIALEVLRY